MRAFESEIEIQVEAASLLHEAPLPGSALPLLRGSGRFESRTFSSLVLENAYLRAEFVPALGGRLLRLRDRRLGLELLHGDSPLALVEDPLRGARLDAGLEFTLDGSSRVTSLAPIRALLDTEDGEIWMHELIPGRRLSYHLRVQLAEDRAALIMEVRLLNRSLEPEMVSPGFRWPFEAPLSLGGWVGGGLGVLGLDAPLVGMESSVVRFPSLAPLDGRVCESFSVEVVPVGGIGAVQGVSGSVAVGFDGEEMVLSSFQELPSAKLILLGASGQTLETVADLRPELPLRFPFSELGGAPQGLVVRDALGEEVFRFPLSSSLPVQVPSLPRRGVSGALPEWLAAAQSQVEYRHLVAARRAQDAFALGDYLEAGLRAEQELLYNGDDPMGWIEKAIAARHDVSDATLEIADAGELANGHFLAPLEPLLRAEAFFRMPVAEGAEPSRFLEPLRESPDELIEVACFLLERGLSMDAARWLEEVLRLVPSPMASYLLAYNYLVASRMRMQAAEMVALAGGMELSGPYPWRAIEREALVALSEAFPGDERLGFFLSLVSG